MWASLFVRLLPARSAFSPKIWIEIRDFVEKKGGEAMRLWETLWWKMIFRFRRPRPILSVQVMVERDGDAYHAFTPGLKGIHVFGETEEEAGSHAMDAVIAYLLSLAKHNEPIPVGAFVRKEPTGEHTPEGCSLRNLTVQWPYLKSSGIS
jgi:predicted RNase H-like HicB family nuclease